MWGYFSSSVVGSLVKTKDKIIVQIYKHVTVSELNGFDSDEYAIPIDFLLGSSDPEQFCSFIAAFPIKYGNVVHDKRKKTHIDK